MGEKVWSLVGPLAPKDKTQLEERLRRVSGPSSHEKPEPQPTLPGIARLTTGLARPGSPAALTRIGGHLRPASPSITAPKSMRPASPSPAVRSESPVPASLPRSDSPMRNPRLPVSSQPAISSSPGIGRPKSMLPSRLGRPRPNFPQFSSNAISNEEAPVDVAPSRYHNGSVQAPSVRYPEDTGNNAEGHAPYSDASDDITITISSILSSDPSRSVDALKKIQKILAVGPEAGPSMPQYRELAEHTEGLIETITLQMAHVFDRPDDLVPDDNFRLAKHLIQTLNNFCDHAFLAESLTVNILTSLLEELTLRLLETDDSPVKKVKDLSRFINMIILRLFATGRRMSIFR